MTANTAENTCRHQGLTTEEVIVSRTEHGSNHLKPAPGKPAWKLLLEKFRDPVILILPEAFFRNCAIAIVTVLLTVCIMLVVTGGKRPSRRSAPGEGAAS